MIKPTMTPVVLVIVVAMLAALGESNASGQVYNSNRKSPTKPIASWSIELSTTPPSSSPTPPNTLPSPQTVAGNHQNHRYSDQHWNQSKQDQAESNISQSSTSHSSEEYLSGGGLTFDEPSVGEQPPLVRRAHQSNGWAVVDQQRSSEQQQQLPHRVSHLAPDDFGNSNLIRRFQTPVINSSSLATSEWAGDSAAIDMAINSSPVQYQLPVASLSLSSSFYEPTLVPALHSHTPFDKLSGTMSGLPHTATNYINMDLVPQSAKLQLAQLAREIVHSSEQAATLRELSALSATQLDQGGYSQPRRQQDKATPSYKNPWFFKGLAPKRRSLEQATQSSSPRVARVNFDDGLESISARMKDFDRYPQVRTSGASDGLGAGRDYLASHSTPNTLPAIVYGLAPANIGERSFKLAQEDHLSPVVDQLLASSKFSSSISHPEFYAAYPAGHKYIVAAPRKGGLEKSLGLSILVGVGAGLITFLIISNLFLSIPLFAMTLFQFLNGNMMMPNNQPMTTPSPNSNQQNGQTSNFGRKKRDLGSLQFEQMIQTVLGDYDRY